MEVRCVIAIGSEICGDLGGIVRVRQDRSVGPGYFHSVVGRCRHGPVVGMLRERRGVLSRKAMKFIYIHTSRDALRDPAPVNRLASS